MNKFKPFHESIVEAINLVEKGNMPCIGALIKVTKIPKNHDVIIEAWEKRMKYLGFKTNFGVTASVLKQKRECRKNFLLYTAFGELMDAGEISKDFWHRIGSKFSNLDKIISATNGWKNSVKIETLKAEVGEEMFNELKDILRQVKVG